MRDSLKSTKTTIICCVIIGILLIGLSVYAAFIDSDNRGWKETEKSSELSKSPTPTTVVLPTQGDTEAEVLVLEVDDAHNRITAYLPAEDREMDLYYTGTSDIRDCHGAVIAGVQVDVASIARVSYDAQSGILYSLAQVEADWIYEKQARVTINTEKEMLTVAGNNYRCGKNVVVMSEGERIALSELASVDELTVCGMGDRAFLIERVSGHGMLQLSHVDAFIGGIFYIDGKEAETVTGDMKMTMREGEYRLALEMDELYAEKTVTIQRGAETEWDLSEYLPPKIMYGTVEFILEPDGADLYIDHQLQENTASVKLEYGEHVIGLYKDGFVDWTGKITVSSEEMLFSVSLVPAPSPTPSPTPTVTPIPTESPNPEEGVQEEETDDDTEKDMIETKIIWYPTSVVTIDSVYAGTTDAAGVLTKKLTYGTHVIELTRILLDGSTQPKTYTVDVNAQSAVLNLLLDH